MASITTLLATDSLASSRIVINDNFNALNDELTDVTNLLDPAAQTLSINGGIQANGITLATGGSNLFVVNSTDVIASVAFTAEKEVILEEGFRHSIVSATTMPNTGSYIATTYLLGGSLVGATNIANAGNDGQEITFIADGGQVGIDTANVAKATSITIESDGALTLRYVGSKSLWYIVSAVECTILF